MDEGIFVPITVFAAFVAIVWLFQHYAAKKRIEAYSTLKAAIEKGQVISPEAMEAMTRLNNPLADLRRGVVLIAVACGFASLGFMVQFDSEQALRPMLGIGSFPLFIGIAFLILHVLGNKPTSTEA